MKKLGCIILVLCCFIMLASCGEKKATGEKSDLIVESWGENQPLSLTERDEKGNIYIVNDKKETVMDVSKTDGAVILVDEITKEPRMIRIDTISGTKEVIIDGEVPSKLNTYTYEYYDTFGEPLLESSPMGIYALMDFVAFVGVWYEASSLVDLSTGVIFADPVLKNYILSDGIVTASGKEGIHFFNKKGVAINTRHDINLNDNNDVLNISAFPNRYANSSIVYSPESLAQEEEYKSDYMYSPIRDAFYEYLERRRITVFEGKTQQYLIFSYPASPLKVGLIDSLGEIVVEADYDRFDYADETQIVAYANTKTDFIDKKTMEVVSSKPYATIYSNGVTSVVQSGKYSFYLIDENSNQLSDTYSSMGFLGKIGDHTYFSGHIPNSQTNVLLDETGKILFTDPYDSSYTLLNDSTLGVQSRAGEYIVDLEGNVVQMYRTYDGHVYNEATGEIHAEEGVRGQAYISVK